MGNILEEFWYGNINPRSKVRKRAGQSKNSSNLWDEIVTGYMIP